jgi:hypothetical protein
MIRIGILTIFQNEYRIRNKMMVTYRKEYISIRCLNT